MGPAVGPRGQTLPQLLQTILGSFLDLCHCDGGSIYVLRRDEGGESRATLAFETMITRSLGLKSVPDEFKSLRFTLDDSSLVGRTALHREFIRQGNREPLTASGESVATRLQYGVKNLLSAPLVTPRGDLVGVVQLLNKLPYRDPNGKTSEIEGGEVPEFDDRDIRMLSIVAGQAALAIENSFLLEEQEKLIEGFVNAFVTAVEARDPVTSGHSERVCDLTVALAEAVNRTSGGDFGATRFNEQQLREIRFAAMLHDVGKISVSESVLKKERKLHPQQFEMIRMRHRLMIANLRIEQMKTGVDHSARIQKLEAAWKTIQLADAPKVLDGGVYPALEDLLSLEVRGEDGERLQAVTSDEGYRLSIRRGSLTQEERFEIERHVSHTYDILKIIPWSRGLESVPEIAHRHHEKLDGSGYPGRILGTTIPVQSRMLTICDIYDALTADDRPYKQAVPVTQALEILSTEVATGKLDRGLFQIFLEAKVYESVAVLSRASRKRRTA